MDATIAEFIGKYHLETWVIAFVLLQAGISFLAPLTPWTWDDNIARALGEGLKRLGVKVISVKDLFKKNESN